jgi:nucleotide-binding universal stress UspA family protein
MLLGSVSRALAKGTRGPLVVVRGPGEHRDGRVVLGVATEPGPRAAAYAFEAAHRYGTGLQAVRTRTPLPPSPAMPGAIDLPVVMPAGGGIRTSLPPEDDILLHDDPDKLADQDEDLVAQAIDTHRARYPQVPVEITCVEGDAATTLNASGEDASLIVLSAPRARHHRGFPLSPGHVVGKLLAHCPAPVAVIPEAETEADTPSLEALAPEN